MDVCLGRGLFFLRHFRQTSWAHLRSASKDKKRQEFSWMHIRSKGTLWSCEYYPRKVKILEAPFVLAVPRWCLQQLSGISFNNLEFPGILRGGWVMRDLPTPWWKSYSNLMAMWGVNGCFEHKIGSFPSPALAQFLASCQEDCFLRHLWWDPRSYNGRWVSQQKKLLAQIAGIVFYH